MPESAQSKAQRQIAASLTRAQRTVVASGVEYIAIPANILPGLYFYGLVDGEASDWTPLGRAMIAHLQANAPADANQLGSE